MIDTVIDDVGVRVRDRKPVTSRPAGDVVVELAETIGVAADRRRRLQAGVDRLASIASVDRVLAVTDPDTGTPGLRLVATGAPSDRSVTLDGPVAPIGRAATRLTATMAEGRPCYLVDSWLDRPVSDERCPYAVGAATRSVDESEPNGDTVLLSREGTTTTVCVVDGLGHGDGANQASRAARDAVAADPTRSVETLFEATEGACERTRGVVMAIARFDWARERVVFGSVGNIATHVDDGPATSFVARRGVLGADGPAPLVASGTWTPTDRFVAHSDGVTTRWDWPDISGHAGVGLATALLERYGDPDDDASVLAVTARSPTADRSTATDE